MLDRRATESSVEERVRRVDWDRLAARLDRRGWAVLEGLLGADECAAVARGYDDETLFRSRVVMRRHAFGEGEYRYYAYPLPGLVARLRTALYEPLAPVASAWAARLERPAFPDTHERYLRACRDAGQVRPTPLLLSYGPGGYNRLHQDLYGELYFPLQVTVLLDAPGRDFEGGELVVTEQKPRSQSRVDVIPLARGDGVVFAVNERPVEGTRGDYRVKMRHGVSEIRAGRRRALGIIFHDAR